MLQKILIGFNTNKISFCHQFCPRPTHPEWCHVSEVEIRCSHIRYQEVGPVCYCPGVRMGEYTDYEGSGLEMVHISAVLDYLGERGTLKDLLYIYINSSQQFGLTKGEKSCT